MPAALDNVTLVSSTNGNGPNLFSALGDDCGVGGNTVTCNSATIPPDADGGWDLVFTADIPLDAAGTTVCNNASVGDGVSQDDCFDVDPAVLTVTKTSEAPRSKPAIPSRGRSRSRARVTPPRRL